MKATKEMVHSKTGKTKEAATVFLVLVFLLAFSLVREPIPLVSGEPDQYMVHVETITEYHYNTEGDVISHSVALRGGRSETSELRNFDSEPVLSPKATFTTTLPVSGVSDGSFIPGSTYQWQFPDLEMGKNLCPTVWFEGSLSFTPDFFALRVMTPSRLRYPGGRQTIIVSVRPQDSEFAGRYTTRCVSLGVSVREDDNVEASILSVKWPSMKKGGKLTSWSQTDENVNCDIADPTTGAIYTLVVCIDIELKDGIKAVVYKPYVMVRDRFYLPPFETIYESTTATSETEAGTWTWETASKHTWLCWNSIQKVVEFLSHSRAL